MGQQQLLLIVLGVIIIAIAIVVGISLFRMWSIDSKRDLIMNENNSLADLAFKYYKTAQGMGGGGNSFIGWSVPDQMQSTATGTHHVAEVYSDSVIIVGTGNEVVTGTDSIKVQTTVTAISINTVVIN